MKLLIVSLLCLFQFTFTPTLLTSQTIEADSELAWLPQGRYSSITHFNLEALQKAQSYPLWSKYYLKNMPKKAEAEIEPESPRIFLMTDASRHPAPTLDYKEIQLPPFLKPNLISITFAYPIAFSNLEENLGHDVSFEQLPSKENSKGASAFLIKMSNPILICRLENPAEQIEIGMEKNIFTLAKKKIGGQPVYTFNVDSRKSREKRFICNVRGSQFLVADSFATLKRMVLAGSGRQPSVLDHHNFVDVLSLINELGPTWEISSPRQSNEELADTLDNNQLDSEALEKIVRRTENMPFFTLVSLNLSKTIDYSSFTLFENNDAAEEFYQRVISGDTPQATLGISIEEMNKYNSELKRRTSVELSANIVRTNLKMDQYLLTMKENAHAAFSKAIMDNKGHMKIINKKGETLEIKVIEAEKSIKK
jgi:hypothetical protein